MMNINKKEQELVDEVMENFDFVRCHQTMRLLDWRWAIPNNQVPTIERLKTSAMNRIEGAIESAKESKNKNHNNYYFQYSGGLKATVWKNRYGQITNIQLEFILSDWHAGED